MYEQKSLRLHYIPTVTVIVDRGRALLAVEGDVVLDSEHLGKPDEPRETGASTT